MEPIPESLEALEMLSRLGGEGLLTQLQTMAEEVVAAVPNCVGMSVAFLEDDLTFTLTATPERMRTLDAAQYLEGGPCEEAVSSDQEILVDLGAVLDEKRWQLFAQISAAHGVRSSLSLPLDNHAIKGSVNLYATTPDAFEGRARALAEAFGTIASQAVANADLSMASLDIARAAPETVESNYQVDLAIGVLAARQDIGVDEAERRLREAAARAAVPLRDLAEVVLSTRP